MIPEPQLVAVLNTDRLFKEYPALTFFPHVTGSTMTRLFGVLIERGVPSDSLQELLDSDQIIITIAGSVFSQLTNDPKFGHDERKFR